MLAGALLDAEVKIGELLKEDERLKARSPRSYRGLDEYGISKNQSHKFQQMAQNPDKRNAPTV
jgi:hypothetical protein